MASAGVEPALLSEMDFESIASANSAKRPYPWNVGEGRIRKICRRANRLQSRTVAEGVAVLAGRGNADLRVGISRRADEDVGVPREGMNCDSRRLGMLAKNNGYTRSPLFGR